MVSGSLARLYFTSFHGGKQGSGPDRGRIPVEWGDFLSVRLSVRPSVPPTGLSTQASQPAKSQASGMAGWASGLTGWAQALLAEPQAWLVGPQAWLAGPQAWLAGPQAWLAGPQAWLDGPEGGRTYIQMYRGKISPFYRTLSLLGPLPINRKKDEG